MPVGLSNGNYYRDEMHFLSSQWDDRYDDNVVTPNKMQTDKQLDNSELDPSTGLGIEVAYKPTTAVPIDSSRLDEIHSGGPPVPMPETVAHIKSLENVPGLKAGSADITNEDIDNTIGVALAAGPGTIAGVNSLGASKGWWRGSDGKPRYEISDEKMALVDRDWKYGDKGKLSDFVEHPELYKAYPELKDMNFEVTQKDYPWLGGYNDVTNTLKLNPSRIKAGDEGLLDVVTHELQHWVQNKEGFTPGTNPTVALGTAVDKLKDRIRGMEYGPEKEELYKLYMDIQKNADAFGKYLYQRNPGEVEANASMARRKLSDQQRQEFTIEDFKKFMEGSDNTLTGGKYYPESNLSVKP